MATRTTQKSDDKDRMNQRPPDPQEAADRPLESKDGARRSLSNPVGEPDATSDTDPYAEGPGAPGGS